MKETPKKPVMIDMEPDAAGSFTMKDADGDYENRISAADLTPGSTNHIETIIKNIRDTYTDQKMVPKRLSSKGFDLEYKAINKLQDLIIEGARKFDSIDELDTYFGDPEIQRLLKWYPKSVPNVEFDRMRKAEEIRCFESEIARVATREEASDLNSRIGKRYNVMGMTSGTAMDLQKILAAKKDTLPK